MRPGTRFFPQPPPLPLLPPHVPDGSIAISVASYLEEVTREPTAQEVADLENIKGTPDIRSLCLVRGVRVEATPYAGERGLDRPRQITWTQDADSLALVICLRDAHVLNGAWLENKPKQQSLPATSHIMRLLDEDRPIDWEGGTPGDPDLQYFSKWAMISAGGIKERKRAIGLTPPASWDLDATKRIGQMDLAHSNASHLYLVLDYTTLGDKDLKDAMLIFMTAVARGPLVGGHIVPGGANYAAYPLHLAEFLRGNCSKGLYLSDWIRVLHLLRDEAAVRAIAALTIPPIQQLSPILAKGFLDRVCIILEAQLRKFPLEPETVFQELYLMDEISPQGGGDEGGPSGDAPSGGGSIEGAPLRRAPPVARRGPSVAWRGHSAAAAAAAAAEDADVEAAYAAAEPSWKGHFPTEERYQQEKDDTLGAATSMADIFFRNHPFILWNTWGGMPGSGLKMPQGAFLVIWTGVELMDVTPTTISSHIPGMGDITVPTPRLDGIGHPQRVVLLNSKPGRPHFPTSLHSKFDVQGSPLLGIGVLIQRMVPGEESKLLRHMNHYRVGTGREIFDVHVLDGKGVVGLPFGKYREIMQQGRTLAAMAIRGYKDHQVQLKIYDSLDGHLPKDMVVTKDMVKEVESALLDHITSPSSRTLESLQSAVNLIPTHLEQLYANASQQGSGPRLEWGMVVDGSSEGVRTALISVFHDVAFRTSLLDKVCHLGYHDATAMQQVPVLQAKQWGGLVMAMAKSSTPLTNTLVGELCQLPYMFNCFRNEVKWMMSGGALMKEVRSTSGKFTYPRLQTWVNDNCLSPGGLRQYANAVESDAQKLQRILINMKGKDGNSWSLIPGQVFIFAPFYAGFGYDYGIPICTSHVRALFSQLINVAYPFHLLAWAPVLAIIGTRVAFEVLPVDILPATATPQEQAAHREAAINHAIKNALVTSFDIKSLILLEDIRGYNTIGTSESFLDAYTLEPSRFIQLSNFSAEFEGGMGQALRSKSLHQRCSDSPSKPSVLRAFFGQGVTLVANSSLKDVVGKLVDNALALDRLMADSPRGVDPGDFTPPEFALARHFRQYLLAFGRCAISAKGALCLHLEWLMEDVKVYFLPGPRFHGGHRGPLEVHIIQETLLAQRRRLHEEGWTAWSTKAAVMNLKPDLTEQQVEDRQDAMIREMGRQLKLNHNMAMFAMSKGRKLNSSIIKV